MKKMLLVLAMIAASVFLAQPASAEGEVTETVTTETTETTEATEDATAEVNDPPPVVDEEPAQSADQETQDDAPPPPDDDSAPPVEEQSRLASSADDDTTGPPEGKSIGKSPKDDKEGAAAPVKIPICHANSSQDNPYVENAPNASGDLNGHSRDTGGLFFPGAASWGDIIPPFTFDGVDYPGLNWTAEGQVIHNNKCNLPGEQPVELVKATAKAPTATPPTCLADGALVIPGTDGVIYESTPAGTGPGSYIVTASAEVGYELTNPDFEETVDVLAQLTGPECEVNVDGLPATAVPASTTPATCSADGELVLPTTPGVDYFASPFLGDTFAIVASAQPGYYLTDPHFIDFQQIPQELTGEQCDSRDITICHRTNINTDPYVVIGPETAGAANAHQTQDAGQVWDPTLKAKHIAWGDIIPPYTYQDVDYPGQNWTVEGQAIYNRGACDGAGVEPIAVTPDITLTWNCDSGEVPHIVATAGVTYELTGGDGEEGPWEITATLVDDDYVLADGAKSVFSGDAGVPDLCVTAEDGDSGDDSGDDLGDEPAAGLLPAAGGLPLGLLLLAGPMTAAGFLILMRRQPVGKSPTSNGRRS